MGKYREVCFLGNHVIQRISSNICCWKKVWIGLIWIEIWKGNCRTRAKEKSRRTAAILTRPFETAALNFRAAVSLRLHKPMTTCMDAAANGRLFCRVCFTILFLLWVAPVKKSLYPPSGYSAHIYELRNHVNRFYNSSAPVCVLQTGAFCCFYGCCVGCRSPPVSSSQKATMKQEVQRMESS